MRFGIILVLMMVIGSTGLFATPAWMTPEMQEAMAQAEALNARMIYETRPEVVAEVFAALDAEIARLESFPRRHRYFNGIQEALPHLHKLRDNHLNCTLDWSQSPLMLYIKLNGIRSTINLSSGIR